MKREIVHIDPDKCNGCGLCVPACHEGAIKIVNGKAVLAEDALCDGLGACLGECPQGAITIEMREAQEYSEITALENIIKEGPQAVAAHLKHLEEHGQEAYLEEASKYLKSREGKMGHEGNSGCGCPGGMSRDFRKQAVEENPGPGSAAAAASQLQQWPVQLRLVNPAAPFFKDAELLVSADCVPFSYADFHRRFLKGKILVVFCPKLDQDLENYVEKLSRIFSMNEIRSVTVCQMEVPCCGGTTRIVEEALRMAGKTMAVRQHVLSLRGELA